MLELFGGGSGDGGLHRVKPGLLFLLRLAWDSRARLPLLIMSGFMALGVRVQMEINIDHAVQFMPRLRLEDEPGQPGSDDEDENDVDSDSDDISEDWTDEEPFETDYDEDAEEEDTFDEDVNLVFSDHKQFPNFHTYCKKL